MDMEYKSNFFYSESDTNHFPLITETDPPSDINLSGTKNWKDGATNHKYKTIPISSKKLCEEFCNDCNFWKNHPNSPPNHHKSCICELFANQSICCLEGYSNLMSQVPYMILYAPTPNQYIFQTNNPYIYPIQINSEEVIQISNSLTVPKNRSPIMTQGN